MFMSDEHEAGFDQLRREYEVLESVCEHFKTRLSEKAYDRFMEDLVGALYDCIEDAWFEAHEEELEASEFAGSIEAVFEVVDKYRGR